jgi:hypothetical protein
MKEKLYGCNRPRLVIKAENFSSQWAWLGCRDESIISRSRKISAKVLIEWVGPIPSYIGVTWDDKTTPPKMAE